MWEHNRGHRGGAPLHGYTYSFQSDPRLIIFDHYLQIHITFRTHPPDIVVAPLFTIINIAVASLTYYCWLL